MQQMSPNIQIPYRNFTFNKDKIKRNMKIEQIYTGCLAQGAYYITSNGEAAIIDPLRETQPYIDRLQKDGVKLKYDFETHFHADFVSGHVDLSKKTGASILTTFLHHILLLLNILLLILCKGCMTKFLWGLVEF